MTTDNNIRRLGKYYFLIWLLFFESLVQFCKGASIEEENSVLKFRLQLKFTEKITNLVAKIKTLLLIIWTSWVEKKNEFDHFSFF